MFGFVAGYADVVMEGKKGRPLLEGGTSSYECDVS